MSDSILHVQWFLSYSVQVVRQDLLREPYKHLYTYGVLHVLTLPSWLTVEKVFLSDFWFCMICFSLSFSILMYCICSRSRFLASCSSLLAWSSSGVWDEINVFNNTFMVNMGYSNAQYKKLTMTSTCRSRNNNILQYKPWLFFLKITPSSGFEIKI